MINTILEMTKKHRETVAYLFFGGLTVVVNTVVFLGLDFFLTNEMLSNTIAFFIAVQFAYFTNTKFVFKADFTKKNFIQFWGMRIGTIFIDNGGMWILLACGTHKLLAKCIVNVVVIILNYIFSKFFIYRKKGDSA